MTGSSFNKYDAKIITKIDYYCILSNAISEENTILEYVMLWSVKKLVALKLVCHWYALNTLSNGLDLHIDRT